MRSPALLLLAATALVAAQTFDTLPACGVSVLLCRLRLALDTYHMDAWANPSAASMYQPGDE